MERQCSLWDLESGKTLRTLAGHRDWVVAVAVIPNGHGAVSASYDRTLRVWDLESGQTVHTLEGHVAKAWLAERRALLVLDDIWENDVKAFAPGPPISVLCTSRRRSLPWISRAHSLYAA